MRPSTSSVAVDRGAAKLTIGKLWRQSSAGSGLVTASSGLRPRFGVSGFGVWGLGVKGFGGLGFWGVLGVLGVLVFRVSAFWV